MRKVFLDDLPKRGKFINWKECAKIKAKINFTYEDINGEVEIVNCEDRYLYIKYLNKEPYKIDISSFLKCGLGDLIGKRTDKFKIEIGNTFQDDKRDLIIINRKYKPKKIKTGIVQEKWYKYHCNKCSYEGWVDEYSLLKGGNCACCSPSPKVVIEGINDIPTTNPELIKYFQGGYDEAKLYTKSSSQKIYPICPDCGRIKDKSVIISNIYKTHSIGCSCSDGQSYPFKLMFNILEQLNISFETEYSPNWCKFDFKGKIRTGRYDFYFKLNGKEYIIETDGGLGHGYHIHGKSKITLEETLEIDNKKDKIAQEHNIKVIRVNCVESDLEYIKKNILDSKLNKLFDLNNVNWISAEEFTLSNLCKKVCEIKRDNPEMTTTEISKIMNLGNHAILTYLKKGSKVWDWINYDPKEEQRKNGSKNGRLSRSKPVEIFKDGKSLGVFESGCELERQSKELFGIKLFQTNISHVCNGKYKQYNGYVFKYII